MVLNLLHMVQAGPIMQPQQMQPSVQPLAQTQPMQSEKDWLVTLLLAIFLGPLGIVRFYAGSIVLGIFKILTFGFGMIWWAVDIVFVITGINKDGNGNAIVAS